MRSRDFNKKKKFYPEFKKGLKIGALCIAVGATFGVPVGLGYGIFAAYQAYGVMAGGKVALGALTGGLGVAGMAIGAITFCVAGLAKDDFRDREESFARGMGRNIVSLTASLALLAGGMKSMQYASSVGVESLNEVFPKRPTTGLNIEIRDRFNYCSNINKPCVLDSVSLNKIKATNQLKL